MTYKNTIISFIMMIIVGLAAWNTMRSYSPKNSFASTSSPLLPDAFMEDISALILDKQGKPKIKIVTPKMVHYTKNDTTHLTMPQLTLYRKSPKPWFITSHYAKATQGIDHVDFWENVNIHHAADEEHPATLIKTSTLTVYPNKQIAETGDFITLTQPNIVVKAKGMHADMNTGNIKLISHARGEYVPS